MTTYQRPLYGFRFAEIRRGDTLQTIAARELGDAALWVDLIAYNDLRPPFVTDDAAAAGDGVLLSGGLIRLPAPTPTVSADTEADEVFGRDVLLEKGEIALADGDFAVASGRANLRQALRHRVVTSAGELMFHPEYGSRVRSLIGAVNGPTAALLAAGYARAAVLADERVQQVVSADAEVLGDVINVSVEAQPIVGRSVSVDATT